MTVFRDFIYSIDIIAGKMIYRLLLPLPENIMIIRIFTSTFETKSFQRSMKAIEKPLHNEKECLVFYSRSSGHKVFIKAYQNVWSTNGISVFIPVLHFSLHTFQSNEASHWTQSVISPLAGCCCSVIIF